MNGFLPSYGDTLSLGNDLKKFVVLLEEAFTSEVFPLYMEDFLDLLYMLHFSISEWKQIKHFDLK